MRLFQWLKTRKDEITATTAILGVLVGICGFWLTINQLSGTRETLQAANTYQVQKDARDVVDKLQAEPQFVDAMAGKPATAQSDFSDKLWLMFNFDLSVFRQSEAKGLSQEFVSSFKDDFCQFLQKPIVSDEWKKMSNAQLLGASHEKMRKEWCGD